MKLINKNFKFLSLSAFFDGATTQCTIFLFPLIAIYLYNTNLMKTSMITFLTFIPNLILSNYIGVFVDRNNKKRILFLANVVSTILIFFLAIQIILKIKSLFLFYMFVFFINCAKLLYLLTYSAYVPILVEKKDIKQAYVILEFINSLVQVFCPLLLGLLIKYISLEYMIIIYAIFHILSIVIQVLIVDNEISDQEKKLEKNYLEEIKESYQFVFSHKILKNILFCYIIFVFSIGIFSSIQSFYILKELNLNKEKLGIIIGLGNIGFFIGTLVSKYLNDKIKIFNIIILSILFYFIGFIVYFFSKEIYTLVIGQILINMGLPIYNINVVSFRQTVVEIDKLAKTSAIFRVFGRGLIPIGALLGGFLGQQITIRYTILFASLLLLFSILPIIKLKNKGVGND